MCKQGPQYLIIFLHPTSYIGWGRDDVNEFRTNRFIGRKIVRRKKKREIGIETSPASTHNFREKVEVDS